MRETASCYWRDGCLVQIEVKCPKCGQFMMLRPAEILISESGEMTIHDQQQHNSPNCDARFRIIGSEIVLLKDDGMYDLANTAKLGLRGRIPEGKTDHD